MAAAAVVAVVRRGIREGRRRRIIVSDDCDLFQFLFVGLFGVGAGSVLNGSIGGRRRLVVMVVRVFPG